MRKLFRKKSHYLSFFVLSFGLLSGYVQAVEEERLEKGTFTLKPIYEAEFEEQDICEFTSPLLKQGFLEKRAKEIFALKCIERFFSSDYKMIDVIALLKKNLGKRIRVTYTPGDKGFVDNLFIEPAADFKTICEETDSDKYEEYLDMYRKMPTAYTEVYYLKDDEEICPLLLNLELLKNRSTYSIVWPTLITYGGIKIKNDFAITQVSSVPLNWIPTILRFRELVDERFKKSQYGHTLTILRPNGTLTLYEVEKKQRPS